MNAFALDPLIAEAKQRARRRRLLALAAAGLLIAGAAVGLSQSGSGGTPGAIPWLPTKPNIGSAHPPLAPACTARQLRATGFFQAAAGSLAGPIDVVNTSSHACALIGRPQLSLAHGRS